MGFIIGCFAIFALAIAFLTILCCLNSERLSDLRDEENK